jgi:hypothetical protein
MLQCIADGSNSVAPNSTEFTSNTLVDADECAFGIAVGANQRVTCNESISLHTNTVGNTADCSWNQYPPACGAVLLKKGSCCCVLSKPTRDRSD